MLKILEKIFKPEIIEAPIVTINQDNFKTHDAIEKAGKGKDTDLKNLFVSSSDTHKKEI